jgi:hypothetical protein
MSPRTPEQSDSVETAQDQEALLPRGGPEERRPPPEAKSLLASRWPAHEALFGPPPAAPASRVPPAPLRAPPWQREEAGQVLERELLLASAEDVAIESSGWRGLRVLALLFLLASLVGAGLYAFHEIEDGWKREMESLQARIGDLEDESKVQEAAFRSAREQTAAELSARKEENQSLKLLVERSLARLQEAVDQVSALEAEREKLQGELQAKDPFSALEVLSRLYPSWLPGARSAASK